MAIGSVQSAKLYARSALLGLARKTSLPNAPVLANVAQVQFQGNSAKPIYKAVTGFLFKPLIQLITYVSIHPNFGLTWIPNRFLHLFPYRLWQKVLPDLKNVDFLAADQTQLKGYWLPAKRKDEASQKTVVLAHGFFSNAGSMVSLAQKLRQQGHNVFMFDFRGHGRSAGKTSIGFHEGKDLYGAVRFLKENYPEHAKDLTVLGHSMGASSILLAPKSLLQSQADYLALHINRMILDAPYAKLNLGKNPFITRTYQAPFLNPQNAFLNRLVSPVRNLIQSFGDQFAAHLNTYSKDVLKLPQSFDELRPAEAFKGSALAQKPVLLLHGTKDGRTSFSQAEEIYRVVSQNQADRFHFKPLEGADHINNHWAPLPGKLFSQWRSHYKTVLRGDEAFYLNTVNQHLQRN